MLYKALMQVQGNPEVKCFVQFIVTNYQILTKEEGVAISQVQFTIKDKKGRNQLLKAFKLLDRKVADFYCMSALNSCILQPSVDWGLEKFN